MRSVQSTINGWRALTHSHEEPKPRRLLPVQIVVGIVKLPKDEHVHASVLCSFVSYSFGNVRKPSFRGEAGIGVGGMTKYYITG